MKQNMRFKITWGTASRLCSLNYISRKKEKEFKRGKNDLLKAINFIIKKCKILISKEHIINVIRSFMNLLNYNKKYIIVYYSFPSCAPFIKMKYINILFLTVFQANQSCRAKVHV